MIHAITCSPAATTAPSAAVTAMAETVRRFAPSHRPQDGAAMNEGQAISAAEFFGFTLTPRWPAPAA